MTQETSAPRLDDKVVVVTGAAGGQGAGEARMLAVLGAKVIATDVTPEPAWIARVESSIEYCRLDVASPGDWGELAVHVQSKYGAVHGLVSNAGITNRARLNEITIEDFQRVLDVNLAGALLGIQAITPLMTDGGSVVMIGSVAALTGHFPVAYTVSKWAVRGLARVASLELGPRGIRVNTIHPGYIRTPMTESAPDAYVTHNLAENPLGRLGEVDDVAPLVAFLLSDASSYISGAEIPVDGGQSAHRGMKRLSDLARG